MQSQPSVQTGRSPGYLCNIWINSSFVFGVSSSFLLSLLKPNFLLMMLPPFLKFLSHVIHRVYRCFSIPVRLSMKLSLAVHRDITLINRGASDWNRTSESLSCSQLPSHLATDANLYRCFIHCRRILFFFQLLSRERSDL